MEDKILQQREHRPFPLPETPWVMQQQWNNLLFAHWPLEPGLLKDLIPYGFALDTFENKGYLSISPFEMRNVKFRLLPPIPTATNFLELNVRTYVVVNGRPGIFFFSLDASSALSVFGAKLGAWLPYLHADMQLQKFGEDYYFSSTRFGNVTPASLKVKYRPDSEVFESEKNSLDEWLTERYCLFTKLPADLKTLEIDIHHLKWPLQKAVAEFEVNTMADPLGIKPEKQEPLLHYSKHLQVYVWPPKFVKV